MPEEIANEAIEELNRETSKMIVSPYGIRRSQMQWQSLMQWLRDLGWMV